MQAPTPKNPISIVPVLPPAIRTWAQPLEPALLRLLIPGELMDSFEKARTAGGGASFARSLLESLNIRFTVDTSDLARVPISGPAIVVANHPYGFVEGLILAVMLDGLRRDYKIVANALLAGVAKMLDQMILVNPFETPSAVLENRAPLREALRWLSRGGLLAMFPAGEVAHLNWREHSVTDPPWKTTAARLALHARCAVVPVFFEGANSVPFQLAGTLHPGLRTINLAREFHKLSGKTVGVRIANPIPHGVLAGYRDPGIATAYMQSRTFLLSQRSRLVSIRPPSKQAGPGCRKLEMPESENRLAEEVAALPAECELAASSEATVYVAGAAAIPRILREIGRCRELTFRAAGEGTGKATDLDHFDQYYQHLFLWSKTDRRLAGAYRLVVTSDVLPRMGVHGLYTSTLFRYHRQFFDRIGPAVELGRSFVMPGYQKNYASLLLLWKGITRFVQRRPEAPVLFGAVSINKEYQDASKGLIANYLSGRASHDLARYVQPRKRFRHPAMRNSQIRRFAALAVDIEDVSNSVADIEHDAKGVPVLLRQYLKAGGRALAFNLDPNFSDVLDALIVADLRTAPLALLERCMGRAEAKAFLESHQRAS